MALVDSITITRFTNDSRAIAGTNMEKRFKDVSLNSTLVPIDILDYNKSTNDIATEAHNMNFSVKVYNSTLPVKRADQAFKEQLENSPLGPITRDDLFRELAPLFHGSNLKEGPLPYAVCLIHHHFLLENGERMITYGEPTTKQPASSRPSGDVGGIIADRWLSTGEEFEHKVIEGGEAQPPPPEFLSKFREIVSRRGVNVLGVCLAPDTSNLSPGKVFMETEVPGKRELEISIVTQPKWATSDVYQTVWSLTDSSTAFWCSHGCCITSAEETVTKGSSGGLVL